MEIIEEKRTENKKLQKQLENIAGDKDVQIKSWIDKHKDQEVRLDKEGT